MTNLPGGPLGDSIYFDARLPHRGRALEGEAKALVVTYSPRFPE